MSKPKKLFYDCEIIRCIPDYYEENLPQYEYCNGWHDFEEMGISVIGAFIEWENKYTAFIDEQIGKFQEYLDEADELVGFNSISFDDNLLAANRLIAETTYDLLCEVRVAAGMPPHYVYGVTRGGYKLDSLAVANLEIKKTGSGAIAPMLWQDGKRQEVINYCLNDVKILVELYNKRANLIDPTDGSILKLRD